MAAIHLADAVGGNLFLGFISAVAFATILAVVSGLTLAGASAISHDLYATVIKGGKANEQDEIRVSKIATIVLGVIAVILGIVFEKQNVAFMVGLAFSIAASCNFPVLLMSMMWRGMTTRGAVIGGFLGLFSALVGVIFSPAVWEATHRLSRRARRCSRSAIPRCSRCPSPSSASGCSRSSTPARAAQAGPGWLRRPICAFADRHRRLRRFGSLIN